MPPRFAYWTILIDNKPTAFRAHEREELLPTLYQLRRRNTDVVMKWFARGRLWESPASQQAALHPPKARIDTRQRPWRSGDKPPTAHPRFVKKSTPGTSARRQKDSAPIAGKSAPDRPNAAPTKGRSRWNRPPRTRTANERSSERRPTKASAPWRDRSAPGPECPAQSTARTPTPDEGKTPPVPSK